MTSATKVRYSRARSLAKTTSWRILASLDTFALSWLVTGKFHLAGAIASLEIITKMVLYYLHERGWARIAWGVRIVDVEAAGKVAGK